MGVEPVQWNDHILCEHMLFCTVRVIDELHPERHFTTNDIYTLMAKLVSQRTCTCISSRISISYTQRLQSAVCVCVCVCVCVYM